MQKKEYFYRPAATVADHTMSMRSYLLTILICLLGGTLFAQTDDIQLLAQSPDGKTVKLLWTMHALPADVTGFDIKRKDGLGDWQKLNRQTLTPEISVKKSLTNAESDATEATRIKEKMALLVRYNKLQQYDQPTFAGKWRGDDKDVRDILELAASDFDVAIMCGFGFVDHTVTEKTDYQYGLFVHGTDKLLARASWNYGEIADLDVIQEITSKAVPGKTGVQLVWNADISRMNDAHVAGFNVYKRGIRLNDRPIISTSETDPSEFTWNDAGARSTVADQYSISTESIFGIEGIIRSYTYNPAEHPSEYKKAVVTSMSSIGFYFKDGLSIKWSFPKEYEPYIKGFYVEKDNMPSGYNRVSGLLSPQQRSFVDQSGSAVSAHIRARVIAVYLDRTLVSGTEKLYSYFPMVEPPKPQNARISGAIENKKYLIRISWDPTLPGDSITHHYRLYSYDNQNKKFQLVADKLPLKPSSFTYTIPPSIGGNYKFYVAAVSKPGVESMRSDTVSIAAPSTEIPVPIIRKLYPDDYKGAIIQWSYPAIQDLAGFRLYRNDTVMANETVLKGDTREFTIGELPLGSTNFTLRAITDRGILSEPTQPATVMISGRKR